MREQLFRVAAEHGFHIFTKSKAANHVRVASADMPYRGAKFHGRGLKIYLCREPAFTGALDAAAVHVKAKILWKILETYYEKVLSTLSAGRAAFEKIALLGPAFDITTEWERNGFW